jgi:hypothetical protein
MREAFMRKRHPLRPRFSPGRAADRIDRAGKLALILLLAALVGASESGAIAFHADVTPRGSAWIGLARRAVVDTLLESGAERGGP